MAKARGRVFWIPRAGEEPRPYHWSVRQMGKLDPLGLFWDRHVELIGGQILERTPHSPPCATSMGLLADVLRRAFGPGLLVRQQGPLDFGRWSLPVPDASVVPGAPRDYAKAFPTTALLVVEVSESSLRFDRTVKARLYARAGIADYWIVNLVDRQLEVHRKPGVDRSRGVRLTYTNVTSVPATGSATPLAAPGAVIAVADLLP